MPGTGESFLFKKITYLTLSVYIFSLETLNFELSGSGKQVYFSLFCPRYRWKFLCGGFSFLLPVYDRQAAGLRQ